MRTRKVLQEKFNKAPRPESIVQNQWILMEILMDIRDLLYSKQDNGFVAPFDDALSRNEVEVLKNSEEIESTFDTEQKTLKEIKKDEPI